MWGEREPRNDAERLREIARLEGLRDALLAMAPGAFAVKRVGVLIVWTAILARFGYILLFHQERLGAGFFVVAAVCALLFGPNLWRTWFNPPPQGDRWGAAACLYYENDSPQEIQDKIDQLRNELGRGPH